MYCPLITAWVAWSEKHTQLVPGGNGMVIWSQLFW